ncbi:MULTISPECIES: TadE/TadG family type IV pilus assembly protein [unclassified Sphingomonas]|uniref:TadE/TadG family type IV pilus assembly protein n=1 Tax=unclassified Sphingomonas TaxID=196159 RepID=UPI0006F5B3C7|nr:MULTISPECIES: TadE family protein [unclassified Sphingomonas]KQM98087.1 hypothetical protein ASE78_07425 [Sphingomonas sp. Leaf25]KQN37723.1 hypothetical protein ASE97_09245 [Sphingomonas sp. Leaf42]KQT28090.1 hypothetical protein ASG37_11955 [Sphingomonas sp. Leaf407]
MIRRARFLFADRRGATIIEFALIIPVLVALIMGLGDLMFQTYVQGILDGEMQKAGRDSALEDNASGNSAIDQRVQTAIQLIAKDAKFYPKRDYFASYALIKPEPIYDKNGNGTLDSKECFDDVNGNGVRDTDPSRTGQGGADDIARYTMRVVYTRPFPVARLLGFSQTMEVSATTLLKNQPYKNQTTFTIPKVCLP